MAIVKKTVQIGDLPTKEALKEVEEAAKKKIVYDFDSPKLESWMLHDFKPASSEYYKPKKVQVTTLPPKGRELPESYSQELFLLLRRRAS